MFYWSQTCPDSTQCNPVHYIVTCSCLVLCSPAVSAALTTATVRSVWVVGLHVWCACTVRVVAPFIARVPRLTCVHMYIYTGYLSQLYAVIARGSSDILHFSLICIYSCIIVISNQLMHWYIIGCCVHNVWLYYVMQWLPLHYSLGYYDSSKLLLLQVCT